MTSNKWILGILSTLVVVVVLLVLAFIYSSGLLQSWAGNPVVASVDSEKIYLEDYNQRLDLSTKKKDASPNVTVTDDVKTSILDQLVDLKVLEKELESRNIELTEQELSVKAKEIFPDYDLQDESLQKQYRSYVRLDVGKTKLKDAVTTWKEGQAVLCRFDRADQDESTKDKPEAKATKEKDKAYAKKYCEDMKTRLEKGETDVQTEIANIYKDPVLGKDYWEPYTVRFSEKFDKDHFAPVNFQYAYNEYDQIKALNSKKGYNLITVEDLNGVESFYAVVYLSGSGQDSETTDFDTWLMDQRGQYDIKIYKDRIK